MAKSIKEYLVILSGQGDTFVTLVDKESWDWINSEPQNKISWTEPIPGFKQGKHGSNPNVSISSGSYDNDRAIHVIGKEFGELKEALNYVSKHQIDIKDTYEGYLY